MGNDLRDPDLRGYLSDGVDPGLRAYMLKVCDFMAGGLAVSGATSYLATSISLYRQLAATSLIWLIMMAPLLLVFFLSSRIHRMSLAAAQLAFWSYAVLMGLSLSGIFLVYSGASVAKTFFITAATFSAMGLYGYKTTRDLTRVGVFLFMGLIGIILASLVNLLLASPALETVFSFIGVILFVALTAYDTQRIKVIYASGDPSQSMSKKALFGALMLYLDFINLFLMLLLFTRDRRE